MADPRARQSAPAPERRIFSVADLLRGLRGLLEDRVGRIWVAGEISNHFASRGGHQYFTLKDDDGQIRCVFFRGDSSKVPFELEDGLDVLVYAEATVYEARGELQLVVRQLEPRGAGALQLAFEQLRRSLEAEGLFDPERKQPLPAMPRRLAVVTSDRGAALRDVIHVTGSRFPSVPLLVSPTRVQGDGAELEIAAAIARAAEAPEVDLLLLVRGGGSLEDLWSFNTEPVVRAIANCPVPIVSGVGHETDFTLADLAADFRAPTPSAAAMAALPDQAALLERLAERQGRLVEAGEAVIADRRSRLREQLRALRALAPSQRLAAQRARLAGAGRSLARALTAAGAARRGRLEAAVGGVLGARPRLGRRRDRLQSAVRALSRATASGQASRRARFASLAAQLDSLSPLAVLGRGFAVARRVDDGRIVRGAADVAVGDRLALRVERAEIGVQVEEVSELGDSRGPSRG